MAQHGLLQSNKVDLSENGVVLTSIHHYGIDSEKLLWNRFRKAINSLDLSELR